MQFMIILGVTQITYKFTIFLKNFTTECEAALRKQRENSLAIVPGRSQDLSAGLSGVDELSNDGKQDTGPQLPLFSFTYVELATDYFSNNNKLGEGGFGPVYKV